MARPLKPDLIGYARVSTDDQATDPQEDELKAAGCREVNRESASGASRTRPVLAEILRKIGRGETLVVVRLDRLARSVAHLLEVIEHLERRGAHFRSLHDPPVSGWCRWSPTSPCPIPTSPCARSPSNWNECGRERPGEDPHGTVLGEIVAR